MRSRGLKQTCANLLRKDGGFTYLEVTIAFGIFMLLSFATFAMLLQAGRNYVFVHEHTIGMHLARSMMYEVRTAIAADGLGAAAPAAQSAAERLDAGEFGVFVFCVQTELLVVQHISPDAPQIEPQLDANFAPSDWNTYIIVVLAFGSRDAVVGRSYGIARR